MQRGLFDDEPTTAKQARDRALAQVAYNSGAWLLLCARTARDIARERPGEIVTGEQLRLLILRRIAAPHHHNVWGAVVRDLMRDGVLEPTGDHTAMATKRSHARSTPTYRLMAG